MTATDVDTEPGSVVAGIICQALRGAGLANAQLEVIGGRATNIINFYLDDERWRLTAQVDRRYTSNVIHVWWHPDDARCLVHKPLDPGHPAEDVRCWLCHQRLGNTQPVVVHVIGPDTPEAEARHRARLRYKAMGVLSAHEQCANPDPFPGEPSNDRPG